MRLAEFQDVMRRTYLERDERRGRDGTFRRLVEEVGELAEPVAEEPMAPERRRPPTSSHG